jgi:hypothetical protein
MSLSLGSSVVRNTRRKSRVHSAAKSRGSPRVHRLFARRRVNWTFMRIEWSLDLPAPCGYLRNPHHMARTWMHEHHDEFVRCGTSEQLNVHHENLIFRSTASQTRFTVPRQSVHNAAAWLIQATLFARSCTQEKLQLSQSDWMQVLPRQISLRVLQLQTLQGHACFLLSVHPNAN